MGSLFISFEENTHMLYPDQFGKILFFRNILISQ